MATADWLLAMVHATSKPDCAMLGSSGTRLTFTGCSEDFQSDRGFRPTGCVGSNQHRHGSYSDVSR
jgi:hypothetical protein